MTSNPSNLPKNGPSICIAGLCTVIVPVVLNPYLGLYHLKN